MASSRSGNSTSYLDDECKNTTRWTHAAFLDVPPGSDVFYRVSSDGGVSWSATTVASNPQRSHYPQRVALWGDMGVECGGILPPSPSFAGGQCTAVPALISDSAAGAHDWTLHFGDTAYNMDDRCGGKGDAFLDAVAPYASTRPHVYTNGNHEGSGELKPYTEFTHRLAFGQTPLAAASGSNNNRWMAWTVGRVAYLSIDPDAWIYPLCYPLLQEQYAFIEAALAAVNKTETPWLVVAIHRALYCTKTTDAECNSEAAALRDGQLGFRYPLEPLFLRYGVDFVFSGHTHHYERTFPLLRSIAPASNYESPRGPIYIQSGIAGTGDSDPFAVPQEPWEAFRDMSFVPTYGRLTFLSDTSARYEQLFNDNGTVFDTFTVTGHSPRAFSV